MAMTFGKGNRSIAFNPTSAFPLDARSYFESYEAALAAAGLAQEAGSTDSVYYYGQTLVVVENSVASFYIIQPDKTLSAVAGESIVVNEGQFAFDSDGKLVLAGFADADSGSVLVKNEDGSMGWTTLDVYTKTETDEAIKSAVADAAHLKRKVVANLEEAKTYVANNADADQYIYMVPTGLEEADDKYDEYVVIVVADTPMLEKVGSWEVNLSGYATTEDLAKKVDVVEGSRLITDAEAEKLASLEDSLIKSVDKTNFEVSEQGQLILKQLAMSQVANLETELAGKVDAIEGWTLLSPTNASKLNNLVIGEDGGIAISGKVNAANVEGLDEWITANAAANIVGLTANNLSSDLQEKINYITSVDSSYFTVTNGKLAFTPTNGDRLITSEESNLLAGLSAGDFNNYISHVNNDIFSVTRGKLDLVAVPATALTAVVGDLTHLTNYVEGTTLVDEINDIYTILTWQSLSE